MLVDDRRLAVTFGQDFEDARHVGPGAARRQLAVAEGARAPLAEEVVALRVERPVLVESADVGDPILDGSTPLEDQGAVSVPGQQDTRRSGPAGPEPTITGRWRSRREPGSGHVEALGNVGLEVRSSGSRAMPPDVLLGQFDGRGIDEMDVVVAAGVEALAEDPPPFRWRRRPAPAGPASLLAARPSSGSPSSRRILATLIDMDGSVDLVGRAVARPGFSASGRADRNRSG